LIMQLEKAARLVEQFEKGILPKEQWTHTAHFTLFYTMTIAHYLVATGVRALTDETLSVFLQQPFLAKEHIHQFYSKELLMSVEARRGWVEPDRIISL